MFVIIFIGESGGTLDAQMNEAVPFIYDNLDLIGFRVFKDPGHPPTEEKIN